MGTDTDVRPPAGVASPRIRRIAEIEHDDAPGGGGKVSERCPTMSASRREVS